MKAHIAPVSLRSLLAAGTDERAALEADRLARIAALEPELRVFAEVGAPSYGNGPLQGAPVGVKDIFDTVDLPTRHGSPIYDDNHPVSDAPLVARARALGAGLAGKTVTTEFAWFTPGDTRNPHDPSHTPGGSSSGSAAGVAAGFFPVALGSQTGGSVIRPASFCGVAGYKPSFRLLPTVGMKTFSWSLDTPGIFARDVADCAVFARLLTGRADLATAPAPARFALLQRPIDELMEPEMLNVLGAFGFPHLKVPGDVEAAHRAHDTIQRYEAAWSLADEADRHGKLLSPALRDYLADAATVTPADYDAARRVANRARKASAALFADCDVLLHASAPGAAPFSLKTTGDSSFNRLWTLLGVPCVNVPGAKNAAGMPLGLQVIAPFGRDGLALSAAAWLQGRI